MPLYEYQCSNCKHIFEVIQKFSDEPLKECLKCGGKLEKVISSPAIHFKGTGWYVTDYARKQNGKNIQSNNKEGANETKVSPKTNSTVKDHATVHGDSS